MSTRSFLRAPPCLGTLAAELVASLPRSSRLVQTDEHANVVLIDGQAGWAERTCAAIAKGAVKAMVVDPTDDDPDMIIQLGVLAAARNAVVALSEASAGDPGLVPWFEAIGPAFKSFVATMTAPSGRNAALLAGWRGMRALGLADLEVMDSQLRANIAIVSLRGRRRGDGVRGRIVITVTASRPCGLDLRAYADEATARAVSHGADSAQPAAAGVTSRDHALTFPTIYETAHRHTLRWLLDAASGEGADRLPDFAADVAAVRALTRGDQP